MFKSLFRYLYLFVLLLLLQVLVLNQIRLGGYINPHLYILFILMLPMHVPGWLLLVSAFGLGMGVDMFSDSLGMHAGASVFMAFCRPGVIRLVSGKTEFEAGATPSLGSQGLGWVFLYSLLLVLLHHTVLFFLEVFSLSHFWQTLQRILVSSAFSLLFVMAGFMLFGRARGKGSGAAA